jgi:hypothetical protein
VFSFGAGAVCCVGGIMREEGDRVGCRGAVVWIVGE